MPNHTANKVTITGPKDTVLAFTTMAKNTSQDFSLNSFLPIPSELKNTTSPVHIMSQSEIDDMWTEWRKKKESKCDTGPMGLHSYEKDAPFGLGITQETYYTLVKKYGVSNWYDWCLINWGTKWDCYNVSEWGVDSVDSETSAATIYYETAWSPITIFWQTISQNVPDCEFRHEFADEGGGFLGNETIMNGRIIDSEKFEWDSADGIKLLERLGRYCFENEIEENVDEARVNE
jgi:hypothetical protein